MADKNDIWIDNLQDALQQVQRYIFGGILSMGLFLLMDVDWPELQQSGDRVEVPLLGKITPGLAATVLFSAYFVFGLLANSAIRRSRMIASKIQDQEVLSAVLTHFSIVTVDSKVIRIIVAVLAPALFTVAVLIDLSRGSTTPLYKVIVGLVLISSPYLFLLYELLNPIQKKPM